MNATNNRTNHDFQILHFLVGSCFTTDGAYALLKDLEENAISSLVQLKTEEFKTKQFNLKIQRLMDSDDEMDNLEAEILKIQYEEGKSTRDNCVNAAIKELEFIQMCIERIQPHRIYSHLPDSEAHEACQRAEWKYELINRAQNCLLTTGSIATDQFGAMRQHPDFETEIMPALDNMKQMMLENVPMGELLKLRKDNPMTLLLPQKFPTINPSLLLKNEG
jgi:hypothetical protein